MNKIFIEIPGFEGFYAINENCEVKTIERMARPQYKPFKVKEKILKNWKNSEGYLMVKLSKRGVCRQHAIHRLLALTFIPNPQPNIFDCVRHLNDDKLDNRLINLAWGTKKDNAYDQMRNGIFKTIKCKGKDNF